MNNQKFQSFIDLVTFDQNFTELEKKSKIVETTIQNLNNQLTTLQKQLEHNSSKKRDVKKQLDAQELQVKDLQDKEKHQLEVVESVASTKELEAASKELEYLKIERNAQEQKMIQHINKLETAEKEYASLQIKSESDIAEINAQINTEKAALSDVSRQIENIQKERSTLLSQVPAEWVDVYENMRGRVKDPVVQVTQDSCGACFSLISSRDLQALRQHELLQCKDCYRFLYCEEKK
ncbi:MAG: hypothetical protein WC747_02990 [Candidatus Babeliales bacterium]